MKSKGAKYLYDGFRTFVSENQRADFDKAFFSRTRHQPSFMISLINEYVDIEVRYSEISNLDPELLAYYQNDYCFNHSTVGKTIKEVKESKRHIDTKFLFK
jgi:hypothetical protein